jgi:hypothetical protein
MTGISTHDGRLVLMGYAMVMLLAASRTTIRRDVG